jgi:hypothetical protein
MLLLLLLPLLPPSLLLLLTPASQLPFKRSSVSRSPSFSSSNSGGPAQHQYTDSKIKAVLCYQEYWQELSSSPL